MKLKILRSYFFAPLLCLCIFSCSTEKKGTSMNEDAPLQEQQIETRSFGKMPDGKEVTVYTLKNKNDMELSVINYGGIIVSLKTPDKQGKVEDVVLGYGELQPYLDNNPYFGALIGRYGNRIANGTFSLDGETYKLPVNNGPNHLHGGPKGFDKVFWEIEPQQNNALKLTYTSKDGEQGYPGNLDVEVIYRLTDDNELQIEYTAVSDKKTIVNLTQHSYFNLSGGKKDNILDHQLQLDADHFIPVDETLIPTGELRPVANTPFDFKNPTVIGSRINAEDNQLKHGLGYDHCWALNNYDGNSLRKVATLTEPESGRTMEVYTTEPGIQFYSGNFLDGTLTGKNGVTYNKRYGLCLETQHYPDSPNQDNFPSVTLNPGDVYKTSTTYKFSIMDNSL